MGGECSKVKRSPASIYGNQVLCDVWGKSSELHHYFNDLMKPLPEMYCTVQSVSIATSIQGQFSLGQLSAHRPFTRFALLFSFLTAPMPSFKYLALRPGRPYGTPPSIDGAAILFAIPAAMVLVPIVLPEGGWFTPSTQYASQSWRLEQSDVRSRSQHCSWPKEIARRTSSLPQ